MTQTQSILCPHCGSPAFSSDAFCPTCGGSLSAQTQVLPSGTLLRGGQYRLEHFLGQGGFGITYRAIDTGLQAPVALKELFPVGVVTRGPGGAVQAVSSAVQADFQKLKTSAFQEARTLYDLRDAGIVRVLSVFEELGTVFMAMEYLEGETLMRRLEKQGPLDERPARALLERLLAALEKVHTAGLLHRDLKPENVMLTPAYGPVLIDFGTALNFDDGKTLMLSQRVVTPHYAPLEQYGSRVRLGPPTDLYALSATLYHLLTGSPPPGAIDRMNGVALEPLDQARARLNLTPLSSELAGTLERSLALKVSERPQSVPELRRLLEPGTPPPVPLPVPAAPVPVPPPQRPVPPAVPSLPPPVPTPTPLPAGAGLRGLGVQALGCLTLIVALGLGVWAYRSFGPELGGGIPAVSPSSAPVPTVPPAAPSGPSAPLPSSSFVPGRVGVLLPQVNVRSGPGTGYAVLGDGGVNLTVKRGQELPVLRAQGGWYEIESSSGNGWISGRLAVPLEPTLPPDTVAAAVAQLESGGEVTLGAGVYMLERPLILTRPVRVRGAGMNGTFLVGRHPFAVVKVNGDGDFRLEDLSVTHYGNTPAAVLEVESERLALRRVRVSGGLDSAPYLSDDGEEGDGLVLRLSAQAQIDESEFVANGWRGLHVIQGARAVVLNSRFDNNGGSGVAFREMSTGSVERSSATFNTLAGIKLRDEAQVDLRGNTLERNGNALYFGPQVSGRAEDNRCLSSVKADIQLEGADTGMDLGTNACQDPVSATPSE